MKIQVHPVYMYLLTNTSAKTSSKGTWSDEKNDEGRRGSGIKGQNHHMTKPVFLQEIKNRDKSLRCAEILFCKQNRDFYNHFSMPTAAGSPR